MEANNFTIEHDLRFLTNAGDFNEQPIFTLCNSGALTGDSFVSLMRLSGKDEIESISGEHRHESLSGNIRVVVGTSAGIWSVTGTNEVNANYIKGVTSTPSSIGMTAQGEDYNTSFNFVGRDKIVIMTKKNNILTHQLSTSGFPSFTGTKDDFHVFGVGIRPSHCQTSSPNGITGTSLVLQYFFNRMELENTFVTSGLTGVKDRGTQGISASILGKGTGTISSVDLTNSSSGTNISTVTGWTHGVCEGGFRLDGDTYIQSDSSSLFNINGVASSSMSVLTFMKISSTSDQVLFSIGSGTTELMTVACVSGADNTSRRRTGVLKFRTNTHTFTACVSGLEIGKWHHIGFVLDGTNNSTVSGVSAYHNGTLVGTTAVNTFPSIETNGRLVLGRGIDVSSVSSLTGIVGLTRVFNRPLSSSEVALNYFAGIPAMQNVNCIRIAKILS